jgi:hypothetical protein
MLNFISKIGESARKLSVLTRETRALTIYFIEIREVIVPNLAERRK